MGKGRAPCCDKSQVKKGPWSPAEDLRLITFIQQHGHENWRALPKLAGLQRCGKSCRLRWINYLRPDVKRGNFTKEEEDIVIHLHQTLGNKWSKIASYLPGRTDNEIKNVWNTHLKKRAELPKDEDFVLPNQSEDSSVAYSSSSSSTTTKHKKRSAETRSDDHHQQGNDNGVVAKKPRVSSEETNQLSSNSSFSSNNSNISSPIDISKPDGNCEDQFDCFLLDDFSEPSLDHNQNILELEVNKPENHQEISAVATATKAEEAVDIPFESDVDFWNMLDGLNSSLPLEEDKITSHENSSDHSSSLGEIENKKWLRYIENELGLEETAVRDGQDDLAIAKGFEGEMAPEKPPEVNSDIGYHHLWPSL